MKILIKKINLRFVGIVDAFTPYQKEYAELLN